MELFPRGNVSKYFFTVLSDIKLHAFTKSQADLIIIWNLQLCTRSFLEFLKSHNGDCPSYRFLENWLIN